MIALLKEETSERLKETQEDTSKQCKEMNKTAQDLETEVDYVKKTQTEAMLEINILEIGTVITEENATNRIDTKESQVWMI